MLHRSPTVGAAIFGQSPGRIRRSSGNRISPCCSSNWDSRSRPYRSHRRHATSSIVILSARSPSITASPLTAARQAAARPWAAGKCGCRSAPRHDRRPCRVGTCRCSPATAPCRRSARSGWRGTGGAVPASGVAAAVAAACWPAESVRSKCRPLASLDWHLSFSTNRTQDHGPPPKQRRQS